MRERVYLDNAATSWPKPPSVYAAVQRAMSELGAPAGRGTYEESLTVERTVADTRQRLAKMIGAGDPRQIVFTSNATDSLNLAIHGWLRPGDHVVTSVVEHNSVLRPLSHQERHGQVTVTRVPADSAGLIDPDEIKRAIQPQTRLIAVTHASNVTGALQPCEEIGAIAAEREVPLLIDAAQTAGLIEIDVAQLNCSLLAAAGHKGLLGPLGVGVLYVAEDVQADLASVRQGGTGTVSELDQQPDSLPDKYESGNLNVPGIFGLQAGLEYLAERGLDSIRAHETQLTERLLSGLSSIAGVTVWGPTNAASRVGVVSCTIAGYDAQEVASMLETAYRIQVRSGLHCAPLMHRALGTAEAGGTVRFSLGPFTEVDHIEAAVAAVAEIAASAP